MAYILYNASTIKCKRYDIISTFYHIIKPNLFTVLREHNTLSCIFASETFFLNLKIQTGGLLLERVINERRYGLWLYLSHCLSAKGLIHDRNSLSPLGSLECSCTLVKRRRVEGERLEQMNATYAVHIVMLNICPGHYHAMNCLSLFTELL